MELQALPRQKFEAILKKNPLLIITVGSLEQHGKHMPLGTDVLIPLGIAQEVAGRTLAVIAPSFPYGLCSGNMSGGGRAFRGTISTSGSALELQMKDVLSEFLAEGICRVLVLNGHSENESSISPS